MGLVLLLAARESMLAVIVMFSAFWGGDESLVSWMGVPAGPAGAPLLSRAWPSSWCFALLMMKPSASRMNWPLHEDPVSPSEEGRAQEPRPLMATSMLL